jgi:hypothetical protein
MDLHDGALKRAEGDHSSSVVYSHGTSDIRWLHRFERARDKKIHTQPKRTERLPEDGIAGLVGKKIISPEEQQSED